MSNKREEKTDEGKISKKRKKQKKTKKTTTIESGIHGKASLKRISN